MTAEPKKHTQRRTTHTIEIKLEVPQFEKAEAVAKKTHQSAKKLWRRRWIRIGIAAGFVVLVALITINILSKNGQNSATAEPGTTAEVTEADRKATVPYYETLLPAGKTIEQLGGWTRVSPPDRNAVFAFTDMIGNNRIVVSQQPLPLDFQEETESQVETLAKGYKATEKITVNGATVHIANSAKGPQTVLFTKSELLFLLRSSLPLSNDDWIGYINTLQ